MTGRSGPLRGVRIVEVGGIGPGPFATMLLGDMGADVIRITRRGAPVPPAADIISRSRGAVVQLDLKDASDRDQALRLAAQADAVIEGFRPGVMERLGLAPADLLAANRRLVIGRMTGWGQSGPLAQVAGHDINYIALSGALGAMGVPGQPPAPPLNLVGDYGGGALYLVIGLLAAILEARSSGEGQVVDAAMVDGSASLMSLFFSLKAMGRWTDQRQDNILDGGAPYYGSYACRDGKFIAIGPNEPQFYTLLRDKMGLSDSAFDRQHDKSRWPEMRAKLAEVAATRTRSEWMAIFEGTDACVTPVLSMDEATGHPHLKARGTFVERDGVVQPAPAPRFSRTASAVQSSPTVEPVSVEAVLERWSTGRGLQEFR